MNLPRYPKYKDSGVEWLGEVPEHWDVDRFKWSVESCRNGIWGDEPLQDDNDIPCVRVADFDRDRLRVELEEPTVRNVTPKERAGRVLEPGDLLLEKAGGGELQPVGCVVLYDDSRSAVCSNFIARMSLADQMDPSFWRYAHAAAYAVRLNTRSIKQTSGIQNLDQQQYLDELAPFPPVSEQKAIARFLDRETSKIDALIAEQRQLVELLKEKRQAVISHALMKGLAPAAPMKPSGIEWLSDVPAHWECTRLARLALRIVVGIAEAATHAYADEGVPILRSTNIRAGRIVGDILHVDPDFATERGTKQMHSGDLVTVRTGNAGVTAVIPPDLDRSQCFTMLITTLTKTQSSRFHCYWMNSLPAQAYFALEGWGTAQVNISVPILKALPVPVPPLAEQEKIADYLDSLVGRFDGLVAEAEGAIELLQERRSGVVSAAVSGQIDVRKKSSPSAP